MPESKNPVVTIDSTDPVESIEIAEEELTRGLNRINPDGNKYRSEGKNVGWQNQSGETTVKISDGRDLLQKLTPNSPWNLEAELGDEVMSIRLSHHDSPTGETHKLTALAE